jgi:hypothetical protein
MIQSEADDDKATEQTDHLLDLISGSKRKETKKAAAVAAAATIKAPATPVKTTTGKAPKK